MTYHVCFVCSGNICRSPMAEYVFRARLVEAGLDGLVEVDSAGTGDWHEGSGADERTLSVLRDAGYDTLRPGPEGPREHVARQFRRSWFAGRDLVVALDAGHLRELRRLAPTPEDAAKVRLLRAYEPGRDAGDTGDLDVPDPYYGGIDGFRTCLGMVESASEGLLSTVREALESEAA
ncbi:low molecular weight protein-tyrosine-phosphatase [Streptomyces sp. NPDC050560]|uniref:low molecular weight protein-tyrosine-phosphatase n=1 Tax=Streptomyces sp. NPDC050560 TaxID=3365630 RepID=UPI0037AE68FB